MRAVNTFVIALSVFAFATAGCKKPVPKEEPPPVVDTTPSAAPTATEVATAATPAAASAATPTPVTAVKTAFKSGDKVDVQWNGTWWAGQILSVNGTQFKIHYIGWASSWDESVPASRLRAPTAGAKKGSGPA